MARRPREHTYDKVATRKLQAVLPDEWIFKSDREVDSGFEYGEDWLIEIVEDEKPTAIELCVQNKVTKRSGKRSISVSVEIDTLDHLHNLGRPVLIHIYSTVSDRSYWMWLEDFYAKNKPKWKGQKTASISIPTTNVLDAGSVKHIREYAAKFHQRQAFVKRFEAISRTDPDYRLDLMLTDKGNIVVFHAKHENPRPFTFTLPNPESVTLFQRSLETGESVRVPATFRLDGIIDTERGQLAIFPLVPKEEFPQKIEIFSDNGLKLAEIPFVHMKLVQEGSALSVWKGQSKRPPVLVTMSTDRSKGKSQVNFDVDLKGKNPVELQKRFTFSDYLISCTMIRFTNLETGVSVDLPQGRTDKNILPIDEVYRKLVGFLATIAEKTGVLIELPDEISDENLAIIENVATIVSDGIYYAYKELEENWLEFELEAIDAQKVLIDLTQGKENQEGYVESEGEPNQFAEILGHKIELGTTIQIFLGVVVDRIDLEEQLKSVIDENQSLTIHCTFDRQQSYIKYVHWTTEE